VAIAFDDGPARLTPAFVRMLERARVPATFFLIGRQVTAGYHELLVRELADGDALGDHTFNHANLVRSSRGRAELAATIARIQAVSGYTPCIVRPPYGAYDRRVLRQARALGLATIMWNVDPRDWSRPGKGAIAGRSLRQVRPGSIILSHDGGGPRGQTLAAYPGVIGALRRRGYRFVTVPELLGFRPVYRECVKLCDGLGRPREALPRNAVVQPSG
jgi:peptidoglycan/xylan/chitin deacetylase (PgdA/CDA1 family)